MNPALAYRFLQRPLALAPDFAAPMVVALYEKAPNPTASLTLSTQDDIDLPYQLMGDIAVVSVAGTLVHNYVFGYGETTYDSIAGGMVSAIANPNARAIVMHISSPGGEVDGLFELADMVYGMRGTKPIWAIADPYAYSAAYALASAADSIFIPKTGGAGSIGVIALHVEMSKMLADAGIGLTVIQHGEQKSERGPFAPLSADARDRIQADVDAIGEMFIDLVARNRGLSRAHVRGTKAGLFLGAAAVENKLADAVYGPQEAFSLLQQELMT